MEAGFERLISVWKAYYFTIPLLYVCISYALHQLVKAKKSLPFRRVFITYIVSMLLLFFNSDITHSFFRKKWTSTVFWTEIETTNAIFELIEALTFYYIFYVLSNSTKKKTTLKVISFLQVVYFIYQFANLFRAHTFREFRFLGGTFSTITLLIITFFILSHFWEAYRYKLDTSSISPFFLCLFGYTILSAPIFAILDGFSGKNLTLAYFAYSVHYFWLSLLCLTIGFYAKTGDIFVSKPFRIITSSSS
ncbi:MAG: hypothetical protein JWP88_675 [Flaviaesturariibacter sp.]|nr:hypothetical protein [Flaviaesturariibacter sp.]